MKIVTIDIETMAHKSYHWRLFNENIGTTQIIKPTYMLSYAYKVNNGKTVYKDLFAEDFHTLLHEVLETADVIVTYNGDKFDMLHINREFVERGMTPPRPVPTVDLYKVVKNRFKFASNRLDFVAGEVLGIHKLDTGGFDLWKRWAEGCERAQRLMERYNKRDVNVTWRLYKALRAWVKNHPYMGSPDVDFDDADHIYECPVCTKKQRQTGQWSRRTRCYAVRQVRCNNCGHWFDGKRKKL